MTHDSAQDLSGRRILVVEDEFYIADDVANFLKVLGSQVIGPAADLPDACALLESCHHIDLAVLDINLQGDLVYSLVPLLQARGIPVIFATGYDQTILPPEYETIPRLEKPFEGHALAELVRRILTGDKGPNRAPTKG
jgi:CheY-like chemotaxis protein